MGKKKHPFWDTWSEGKPDSVRGWADFIFGMTGLTIGVLVVGIFVIAAAVSIVPDLLMDLLSNLPWIALTGAVLVVLFVMNSGGGPDVRGPGPGPH